jgi:hypothetical protein
LALQIAGLTLLHSLPTACIYMCSVFCIVEIVV